MSVLLCAQDLIDCSDSQRNTSSAFQRRLFKLVARIRLELRVLLSNPVSLLQSNLYFYETSLLCLRFLEGDA
jgi:hypothetical protein